MYQLCEPVFSHFAGLVCVFAATGHGGQGSLILDLYGQDQDAVMSLLGDLRCLDDLLV